MKIDECNLAIIKHLREGRKSFKKIADDLDLSENTVRTRVRKLEEEGVLRITGLDAVRGEPPGVRPRLLLQERECVHSEAQSIPAIVSRESASGPMAGTTGTPTPTPTQPLPVVYYIPPLAAVKSLDTTLWAHSP